MQYYTVTIEMNGGFKWTILKSYEEFSQLHKIVSFLGVELTTVCVYYTCNYNFYCGPFFLYFQLMQSYNGIDKSLFPHRKMFGSHKLENITEMQSRLNQYLSSVLKYFMLPPPQILQFLEYRFSVCYLSVHDNVHSILKTSINIHVVHTRVFVWTCSY